MALTDVFSELNSAHNAGVIGKYAVGGAVAAAVYLEPAATDDVDIFVAKDGPATSGSVTLGPLYSFCEARGAHIEGERLVIASWLVQLLPLPTPLVEDALANAEELEVDGTMVPVFTQEHLAAIAVDLAHSRTR